MIIQPRSTFNRRAFLAGTTAGVVELAAARSLKAETDPRMLVIDCHAHIYGEDEVKYSTIERPYRPPAGKGTIKHLRNEMAASGIRYVTAIQTGTFYRFDNRCTSGFPTTHKKTIRRNDIPVPCQRI